MLAAICSMEEEASSAAAACSVAPDDNCSALADISWLPEETLAEAPSESLTTTRSFSTMPLRARPSVSLSESGLASTVRSPPAMASATFAVARKLAVMRFRASIKSLISSSLLALTCWLRSPFATASASPTARRSPPLIPSANQDAAASPISIEARTATKSVCWALS